MLGRNRIKELETEVANLKEIISGKNSKISRLGDEIHLLKLILTDKNTEIHRLKFDLLHYGVWPEANKLIQKFEYDKLKAENEKLKNTKWRKEYQKVMRKLEKITNQNKPF